MHWLKTMATSLGLARATALIMASGIPSGPGALLVGKMWAIVMISFSVILVKGASACGLKCSAAGPDGKRADSIAGSQPGAGRPHGSWSTESHSAFHAFSWLLLTASLSAFIASLAVCCSSRHSSGPLILQALWKVLLAASDDLRSSAISSDHQKTGFLTPRGFFFGIDTSQTLLMYSSIALWSSPTSVSHINVFVRKEFNFSQSVFLQFQPSGAAASGLGAVVHIEYAMYLWQLALSTSINTFAADHISM
ncbi:hypothetical protein QTP88_029194 [Uroleucon formosanum]